MKLTQRLLVLLITVTMMLPGSFVQAFASEEAVDGSSVVVSEETAGSEENNEEIKEEVKSEETPAAEAEETAEEKGDRAEDEEAAEETAEETEEAPAAKPADGKLTYDCDDYTVTLEYGSKAGIPEGTVLDVREILADSKDKKERKEYKEYYDTSLEQIRSEMSDESIDELSFARFYDITLMNDGKEIEPQDDVVVTFTYNKGSRQSVAGKNSAETISVVHLTESEKTGELEAEIIEDKDTDLTLEKKELKEVGFTTASFSVYGIIDHEGGEVKTPRVEFHFIEPVAADYVPDSSGSTTEYTSGPYEFTNKSTDASAGKKQASMIVRDGDTLESMESPESTLDSYFFGWYTVDMSEDTSTYDNSSDSWSGNITYSWPEEPKRIELDNSVTISDVEKNSGGAVTSLKWTVNGVSQTVDAAHIDADGCAHVYLAPIYENYHFINFHLGARSETTAANIMTRKLAVLGNSNTASIRIGDVKAPSTDPVHQIFVGWEYDANANIEGATGENWTLIRTMDMNGEEIKQEGKDGTYMTVGDETVDLYPVFVQARWIDFNLGKPGNGALYVSPQFMYTSDHEDYPLDKLPTATRSGYRFDGWYLSQDQDFNGTGTKIADGNGNVVSTDYEHKDSGNNTLFKIQNGNLYVYEALNSLTLYAKWVPNIQTTYKVVIWKQKVTDAPNASDAEKTYDFYAYSTRDFDYVENGNSYIVNPATNDLNYHTRNPNGDFTGFHLGRYDSNVAVDTQGSTVLNVYYDRNVRQFEFQINDYTYTVSVGDNDNNPEKYGDVNNQKARVYWNNGAFRTTNNRNGPVYNGTVYTRSNNATWQTIKTIEALYEHSIADQFPIEGDNGVTYDNGERWMPQNDSVWNQVVVYVDSMPDRNVTFHLDTSTANTRTINYYVEVLPGETPAITYNGVGYKLHGNPVNVNVNFFTREDNTDIYGFSKNGSNPPFDNNGQIRATAVNFYYTRNKNDLSFSANYPDTYASDEPAAQVFSDIPYEQSLAPYAGTAAPAAPNSDYFFDGWYEDASGTVPYDFTSAKMPAANKIIYAKWSLIKYPIHIDPNGGVIDHINYGDSTASNLGPTGLENVGTTAYDETKATYFENEATQTIGEYTNVVRPYVEISDAEAAQMDSDSVYRYVYTYFSALEGGEGRLTADARNAIYIRDTEASLQAYYNYYVAQVNLRKERDPDITPLPRAQWESTYVSSEKYRALRSGEQYIFLGWYEIDDQGNPGAMPFDFSQPAEKETKLRAYWRLDGGYSLDYATEYYTDTNDLITGNLETWRDPANGTRSYTDGATTHAMQEPTAIMKNHEPTDEYQFRGWQIVKVETVAGRPRYTPLEPGVYYSAGQALTVKAKYADDNMIIHLQAVYELRDNAYRRPDVVGLTLDASADVDNAGQGYVNTDNSSDLPTWTYPGHQYINGITKAVASEQKPYQILLGDAQSNTAVHLYKYATTDTHDGVTGNNFFTHELGYKLIGFDLDARDNNFVPDYAADAVVAVSPKDQHTLYAVWEPLVYLTFVNDTGVGDVTFRLSGTGNSMYIVNQANGEYSREALDPNDEITVAEGETLRLAVPYGSAETITVSGTNSLGTGYLLTAKSELGTTDPQPRTITGTYSRVPNTEDFNFSDQLVTDAEGVVITFTAEKAPHTLILKDNYNGDGTGGGSKETTFSEKPNGTVYYQTETTTSYTLPSTSTRIGWELLGWDTDPETTSPAYTTGAWTISDLTEFFTSSGSTSADIEEKTLYAIWKANNEASTVYVWKDVPEPGDQSKDFTFNVAFGGKFSYIESESYTSWFQTRYRWKSQVSSGTIASNTAQGNSALLSKGVTLKHNQYLKIVTVKNQENGTRPYLTMTVSKWQRNPDGSPDSQLDADDQTAGVQNEVELNWYWKNETRTGDPTGTNQYKDFSFYDLDFSVTEADYSAQYDLDLEVAAQTTAELTPNKALRRVTWEDSFAGGTVIFTNTRKTADVTITKTLLPDTLDASQFPFEVEFTNGTDATHYERYTLDPATRNVTSGSEGWTIEDIPTEATLKITENLSAEDREKYDTVYKVGTGAEQSGAVANVTVSEDTTVAFTNTKKTQKVRLVVVDDDDPANPLDSANFTFPGVFEGTKFSAADTGLVFEDDKVFVGEYTLTETSMPDHAGVRYTKLQAPVTVNIAGGTGGNKVNVTTGNPSDIVTVSYDNESGFYTITVVNPRLMRVTLKKSVVRNYSNNSFLFNVTLKDSNGNPIEMSNVNGTAGTNSEGKLPEFTLVNNQSVSLFVPRNAKLTVAEKYDDWYETVYQTGPDADNLGPETEPEVVTESNVKLNSMTIDNVNDDKFILFTNKRKMIDVVVNKTVVGAGGTFRFIATVKNSDDDSVMTTFGNDSADFDKGKCEFLLSPERNGTDSKILTIPRGSVLEVKEAGTPSGIHYTTTASGCKTSDPSTSVGSYDPENLMFRLGDTLENATVTFVNTEGIPAPTSVSVRLLPYILIFMIGEAILLMRISAIRRRKNEGIIDEDKG